MAKRLVIAGCRKYACYTEAAAEIERAVALWGEDEQWILLSGGCEGADRLGERFALEHGWEIEHYMPLWERYGRAAGPLRNKQMVGDCDAVLCFWDGKSRGTASLIRYAKQGKKPLIVCNVACK